MTFGVFRIRQGQHNNRSPLYVGFDFRFWNVNVKVFVIVEFVYVRVNGTQEYVHDSLNTTTVVVLQVLSNYEIIYMKWVHQCQKSRLKSLSPMSCPLSLPKWG